MVKSLFKLILVLMMSSSLFSCALSPDELESLDNSTRSYERAIRWGEFSRAKSFHKNSPSMSDLERRRMKFYRVTNYAVLQNDTPNLHNSFLLVEIKYYKNDRPVIKSITVKQHWKRDKGSEVWYLDSSFPKFR
ncbi:MAG: hypothetical protein BMS9Abin31_1215 [Gammaproteobacteria bacterium]|nr:MAG: hypothetical protein BMS9Abin31_1215 [Gammaproteobacteria bacterium]